MKRKDKVGVVTNIQEEIKNVSSVFVVNYRGLNVQQMYTLRVKLKDQNSKLQVIKNSLSMLAFKDTKYNAICESFIGPTALIYVYNDSVQVAKAIVEFSKAHKALTMVGAIMDSTFLDADGIVQLSKLPSLPEIQAKIIGLLQTPATKFMHIINEPARRVAYLINKKQA